MIVKGLHTYRVRHRSGQIEDLEADKFTITSSGDLIFYSRTLTGNPDEPSNYVVRPVAAIAKDLWETCYPTNEHGKPAARKALS